MKKTIILLSAMVFTLLSCAEENSDENTENQTEEVTEHTDNEMKVEEAVIMHGMYYHGIKDVTTPDDAVSVEEMNAIIDSTGEFSGKINAQLTAVCKKAGCWVTIDNGDKEDIRVMFGEHDFFVPTDTETGKNVVLQGHAVMDTTSVEMQKHFLDDAKEAGEEVPQSEYDAITEDKIEVSFVADAILIEQ